MPSKLEALRSRLLTAQQELIHAAAEAGTLPSDKTLRKITDLEVTIGAVEALIDESQTKR